MTTLKGLTSAARAAVTEDFRRGDVPTVDVSAYAVDLPFDRPVCVEPLRELIAAAMTKFGNDPAKSDPWLGPRVHAAFRLTRREAADKRLWQHLAVVEFAGYVVWRWGKTDAEKAVPLDRYFGEDTKQALSRLWWTPELTRNGSDYSRAETAMGISRVAVSWMEITLSHHRPCILAVIDLFKHYQGRGLNDTQGQVMAKAVNIVLRTVCLDALAVNPPTDAEATREWVRGKVDPTLLLRDELPVGPDELPVPDKDIAAVRKLLDDLAERIDLSSAKSARRNQAVVTVAAE